MLNVPRGGGGGVVGKGLEVGVGVGTGAEICLELEPEPGVSKMGGSGNPGKKQCFNKFVFSSVAEPEPPGAATLRGAPELEPIFFGSEPGAGALVLRLLRLWLHL